MNSAPTLTQAQIAAKEKALGDQGWAKQFTTFPDRLLEFLELYEELGFDVRVESWALSPNADASCEQCVSTGDAQTVFIRKKVTNSE